MCAIDDEGVCGRREDPNDSRGGGNDLIDNIYFFSFSLPALQAQARVSLPCWQSNTVLAT